jgi:hypothetical protein
MLFPDRWAVACRKKRHAGAGLDFQDYREDEGALGGVFVDVAF